MDVQAILVELERLLESPKFRSRKLIKKFLRYVVLETLAGRGETLNQYTIAVNALDRPEDFSPVYNPMVRIEAGRLRKLLDAHYANSHDAVAVRIRIPKGTYQAEFQWGADAASPMLDCLIEQQRLSEGPRLFVHFQLLHDAEHGCYPLLCKVRGDLLLMLSRFRNVRLISSASLGTGRNVAGGQRLQDAWNACRADYLLACDVNVGAGGVEWCFLLAHVPSDETVWRTTVILPDSPSDAALQAMYRQVSANTVSLHTGLALQHWAQYWVGQPEIAAHQRVQVFYLAFLREMTLSTFQQALTVCQQRIKAFPDDSRALVIFARLCAYDVVLQYQQVQDRERAWTQAARLAMKLDTGNAEAHSVFAYNSYVRGDYALCQAELEVARQANPFDLSGEYLRGLGLCMLGDWDAGMAVVNDLMAIPCQHPDWYHVLLFLYDFNRGQYAEALTHAERVQCFGFWGEFGRCACYARVGQLGKAQQALAQLQEKYPDLLGRERSRTSRFLSDPAFQPLWETVRQLA